MPDDGKPESLPATASAAVASVAVPPAAGIPAEAAALARAPLGSEPDVQVEDVGTEDVGTDVGTEDDDDRDSIPTQPRSLVPLPDGYSSSTKRSSIPPGKLSLSAAGKLQDHGAPGFTSPSQNPAAMTPTGLPSPVPVAMPPAAAVPGLQAYTSGPPPPPVRRSDPGPSGPSDGPGIELPRPPASSQPPIAARPAGPPSKPPSGSSALTPMRIIEVKRVGGAPAPAPATSPADITRESRPNPPPISSGPNPVAPAVAAPPVAAPPVAAPVSVAQAPAAPASVAQPAGAPPVAAQAVAALASAAQTAVASPVTAPASVAQAAVASVAIPAAAVPVTAVPVTAAAIAQGLAAPGPLGAEAPTPPDTPVAVAHVSAARISLSPDAPTPPETPALRRDLWQRISGATPPEMAAVKDDTDDEAPISVEPAETPAARAAEAAHPPEAYDVHVGDAHDHLEAISEDELTEVDAVSDRAPEVKPARRLPRRPAKRTTFSDGGDSKRRHWWEELWSDDFQRAELPFPDREFKKEVDFIESSLALETGGVVLDLACGAGPYSIELARRGYTAVGYDLSAHQLQRAGEDAERAGQKVNFLQGDVRDMEFDAMFDGVFCWGTSFGYFEEEKNLQTLVNVFKALKPGGSFLLDIPNRDFVLRHQPMQSWFEGDACVCMDDTYIDFITSRLCVKRTVMLDDGRNREWYYSLRLYALHEVGKLLHDVGFKVAQVSGHVATRGAFLGGYSPRVIALAVKPS